VALCQARISTKPLWGFSSSNPYHSQSRAEQFLTFHTFHQVLPTFTIFVECSSNSNFLWNVSKISKI
jgi:hypothetical protein